MKRMKLRMLGAPALGLLLAACGDTGPVETTLGPAPELRTLFINTATGGYVACDRSLGTVAPSQNVVVVEFSTQGTPSININLLGASGETAFFLISDLRRSSRGNHVADIVSNRLVPAAVDPLALDNPQYLYVNTFGSPRGSFRAQVTLPTPTGDLVATTGSVEVYPVCQVTGKAESRD